MQNFVQPGKFMELVAPYDRLSGQGAKVGAAFGIATVDVLSGATANFLMEGVVTHAKTSAQAWAQGDRIYWDDTNKRCDNVSTVGEFIGVAAAVAANPSSTGYFKLNEAAPAFAQGKQAAITALTFGTNVTAATANGSLEDSAATNPSDTNFNNNMKELGTKVNAIIAALQAVGILT